MTIIALTRRLLSVSVLAGAAVLGGCAALRTVDTSVATFGAWPPTANCLRTWIAQSSMSVITCRRFGPSSAWYQALP